MDKEDGRNLLGTKKREVVKKQERIWLYNRTHVRKDPLISINTHVV